MHAIVQSAFITWPALQLRSRRLFVERGARAMRLVKRLVEVVGRDPGRSLTHDDEAQPFGGAMISERAALGMVGGPASLPG